MKDTELRKVSIAAIDAWGMDEQLLQLQEEAAELIAAASHYRRGLGGAKNCLIRCMLSLVMMRLP